MAQELKKRGGYMNKKRWILLLIPAVLVVVGSGLFSYAGPLFPGGMGIGPLYRMNMLFDELGLTGDQRAALKQLFEERRKDLRPLVESVKAKGMALRELVLAETPNEAAIRKASADLGNAIADAAIQASALVKEARSTLTPEQWEKLKEMRLHRQKVFRETVREWREQSGGL
jgi:Spy/CpxP family protein refolding chaperone